MEDFLDLSAKELLKEFGEGSHIPGSGSANALSALLAIGMMKTVCKITLNKPNYRNIHKYFHQFAEELTEKFEPLVEELFQNDIKVFDQVMKYRRLRDASTDESERENFHQKSLEELKIATEIQIQICEVCLKLFDSATAIFDRGYKAVRGDSGVAISGLLSASFGSLFVIFLNLKSFPESDWLENTQIKAEALAKQLVNSQATGFEKILDLHEELKKPNKHFKDNLFSEE
jgi:formiminotetrahydrofolate cyclodeaminase